MNELKYGHRHPRFQRPHEPGINYHWCSICCRGVYLPNNPLDPHMTERAAELNRWKETNGCR
jgi:hypothetical protein